MTSAPETTTTHTGRKRPGRKPHVSAGFVVGWIVMAIIIVISLFPFWWMIKVALTHNANMYGDFGFWPKVATVVNFKRVLGLATPAEQQAEVPNQIQHLDFFLNLMNSVIFTVVVALVTVASSALAAYAFSRLKWRFRDLVFNIFLCGLMVPPIFGVLPNFLLMKQLGWVYSWQGLLAPYLLACPFGMFFLRQFFLSIPEEVEEAARLDGLNQWGIFRRICLPMSIAPICTLLLIQAVFAWNEYMWPQLITHGQHAQVLTVALASFVQNSPGVARDWTGFMAAATLTVLPLVILMLAFGRTLVSNLQLGTSGK